MPLVRHAAFLALAAAGVAGAQSAAAHDDSSEPALSANESSSLQPMLAEDAAGSPALPAAPAAGAAQQDADQGHGLFHHLTFEAGAGFNAPAGSSSNYITWGGQFAVGAGYRFTRHVSLLTEYQFIDDKLPGKLIAETGANGGYAHIWSLTLDPVIDLFPKSTNDVYVTGGGGFYRKTTSFTDPEETEYCDYFICEPGYANEVVGHFSSNQGGWNFGGGFEHRMGGVYGDGKMKLFAEVRYLEVMTPAVDSQPNGLGTTTVAANTRLIPITLGVRW
jgi:hypothetical protein